MEEEKHLLSNHADIEAIITAIEHFLHVETFPDERKLLEESRLRQGRFRDSSDRLWGELYFSTHYINNERYQRKIWRVNFDDHHRCTSRSHNERPS